jgi:hypothetical protein
MSKLIDKNFKVNSCWNCPFFEYQDEMSSLGCRANMEGVVFDKKAENAFHQHENDPYLHPECPLRNGKILVELKKE